MPITFDDLKAHAEMVKSGKPGHRERSGVDPMWEEFPTLQAMHPEMKNCSVHQAIDKLLNEGNEYMESTDGREYQCANCEKWHENKYDALHCCNPEVIEQYVCHWCGECFSNEQDAIYCCEHSIPTRECS